MDFNTLLKGVDSIDKLKCKICNNFLSYFPIYTSADNRSVCGRCPKTDDQHLSEAYEALAQFIKFPCQYEGCRERILPKDMPHHVLVCPHKIIKCPTYKTTECSWKGASWTALQHCRFQHCDLFLAKKEFQIDLEDSHETENLVEFDQRLFIVWRKFDLSKNLLQYSIYHTEDEINMKNISCKLKLTNCERDIVDTCVATGYNEQAVREITLDVLKLHNTVSGTITLDSDVSVEGKVNEEMLFHLKCSICSAYALPPIYHEKDNNIKCSECAKEEGLSRNYNLDNIAYLLNYPCKYLGNGCTLVLKAEEMKKHHKVCYYGSDHCPVKAYAKCEWFGLKKNIKSHIQEQHQDLIRDNYSEIYEQFSKSFTKCYILKVGDEFFKLLFPVGPLSTSRDDKYNRIIQEHKWSLQTICQYRMDIIYEIEIIDLNNKGRKLMAKQLCQPPMMDSEVFDHGKEYCSFSYNQVYRLCSFEIFGSGRVTFKVCVQ